MSETCPTIAGSIPGITDTGFITDAVVERMNDAATAAADIYNAGIVALSALAGTTYNIVPDTISMQDLSTVNINAAKPGFGGVDEISMDSVTFDGSSPDNYIFQDFEAIPIPEYTEKDYGFAIPSEPTVTWPTLTSEAPSVGDITVPGFEEQEIPPVPTLTDLAIPSPPEYNLPSFEGTFPVDDISNPEVSFSWEEEYYSSRNKTKLADDFYNLMVAGGTGLNEATEQAIWDRATSRQEEENQALHDSVSESLAARGFDLPPGAIIAGTLEAENKILRTREDLNNDILIQQSKLAQENTHFIYSKALELESICINYHSSTQDRSLDAAKAVVTMALQVYMGRVEAYKAKLVAYQTIVEVYKARIEGEIAKATFYRAQIDAVQASATVQMAYIEAYKVQIMGIQAVYDAYKTRMQGAQIEADIDKIRMEGFLTEVQAYSAKVQATVMRYEGYKAQLQGEATKAEIYKTDVQAFESRVGAYGTRVQAEIAKENLKLEGIKTQASSFIAMIQKYSADVNAAIAKVDAEAKVAGISIDEYKADISAYQAELSAVVARYQGEIEHARAQAEVNTNNAKLTLQAMISSYELAMEAAKGSAQVAGQMGAAALGSINSSLHASSSEGRSDSRNISQSVSSNYGCTTVNENIEEHIYSLSE